jgi:hypothetical protein
MAIILDNTLINAYMSKNFNFINILLNTIYIYNKELSTFSTFPGLYYYYYLYIYNIIKD